MTCLSCVHFRDLSSKGTWETPDKEIRGECALYPVWVPVHGLHYCGQYQARYQYSYRQSATDWRVRAGDYKDRAITAEKKLKALRQQLRERKAAKPARSILIEPPGGEVKS